MKKLLQLGLIVAGTAAVTLTTANAKCAGAEQAPKAMKCQAGKCGGAMKEKMKGMQGKHDADMNKSKKKMSETKEKMKGKCGQGKCS